MAHTCNAGCHAFVGGASGPRETHERDANENRTPRRKIHGGVAGAACAPAGLGGYIWIVTSLQGTVLHARANRILSIAICSPPSISSCKGDRERSASSAGSCCEPATAAPSPPPPRRAKARRSGIRRVLVLLEGLCWPRTAALSSPPPVRRALARRNARRSRMLRRVREG